MATFGRFTVPPLRATLNVAWETFKATLPDTSPCFEAVRKATGGGGGGGGARPREPGEHVRFAQFGGEGHQRLEDNTELSTMPGGGDYGGTEGGIAEDGFIDRKQSYQHSRGNGSLTSVDFGSENGGGGGEFGEGRSKHKINEWQAAWNVTNAIQVSRDTQTDIPTQNNFAGSEELSFHAHFVSTA